jgi:hypothetical protein
MTDTPSVLFAKEYRSCEAEMNDSAHLVLNPQPDGHYVKEKNSWNRSHVGTCWQQPLLEVS